MIKPLTEVVIFRQLRERAGAKKGRKLPADAAVAASSSPPIILLRTLLLLPSLSSLIRDSRGPRVRNADLPSVMCSIDDVDLR